MWWALGCLQSVPLVPCAIEQWVLCSHMSVLCPAYWELIRWGCSGTATVIFRHMLRIEAPARYPSLQDRNGDGPHIQIRLNLSKANVPQTEAIRAHQSSKWYRRWTCMAARAFSNVQPAIWNRRRKIYWYKHACTMTRGWKVNKVWCRTPHAYLPRTREPRRTKYSVWSCLVIWRCFPFESWKRNEGRSNLLKPIAHVQMAPGREHPWLVGSPWWGGASAGSRMMSSMDHRKDGIPWKTPREGIKGGAE